MVKTYRSKFIAGRSSRAETGKKGRAASRCRCLPGAGFLRAFLCDGAGAGDVSLALEQGRKLPHEGGSGVGSYGATPGSRSVQIHVHWGVLGLSNTDQPPAL